MMKIHSIVCFALRRGKYGLLLASVLLFVVAMASAAQANLISFNTAATPEGSVVTNQFDPAVSFTASPLSGDDSSFYGSTGYNLGTWATDTDAHVTATDVGVESRTVAGVRQLQAYGNIYYVGWLNEDGDPAYLLTFSSPIASITATFAGDSSGSSGLAVDTGGVLSDVVHVPSGAYTSIESATLTGLDTNSILVVPGAFDDWASVVSINYTPAAVAASSSVPEPATLGMISIGILAVLRRRATR